MAEYSYDDNVRIGEPESLVKPGDPVPGKPGHYYESGQYAPSPERLSAIKLQESIRAGLLPTILQYKELREILNDRGEVDVNRLKNLDFAKYFRAMGITDLDPNLPPFAAIGVLAAFLAMTPQMYPFANIRGIGWVANIEGLQMMSQEEQMDKLSEATSVYKRNAITGYLKRQDKAYNFMVLQPYFVYMSVPILPAIPNVSSGLSVATLSSAKTVGAMVGKQVQRRNKELWTDFVRAAGWKRKADLLASEAGEYFPAGWEIGAPRKTSWVRNVKVPTLSANFVLSPIESFSEAYAFYWFHRQYMKTVNPQVSEQMDKIIEYITEVV